MMFGPSHYVPVLKAKRGEKTALQLVAPNLRAEITPLLEIVEWRGSMRKPTLAGHLDTAFLGLAKSLRLYPRCFLDARELEPEGKAATDQVFDRAASDGLPFTPVTGLSRTSDVSAALRHGNRGLAIRLTRDEFEAGNLPSLVHSFVTRHAIDPAETDLIVDLGPVGDMVAHGVARFAIQFLADIPSPVRWRTLILSASSFPVSMGGVHRNSHSMEPRGEWVAWRDFLRNGRAVPREPTYSDCAIQHPFGVEGFDPRVMRSSASVRYALADDWLLIKGESTRSKPASQQFPQLAKQLVYGYLRGHFLGTGHCQGCVSIKAAADGQPRLGSPEVWRRLGTIHHITQVSQALRSLYGP